MFIHKLNELKLQSEYASNANSSIHGLKIFHRVILGGASECMNFSQCFVLKFKLCLEVKYSFEDNMTRY